MELAYLKRIHAAVLRDIDFVDDFSRRITTTKMDALEAVGPVVRGFEPLPKDVETFLSNVSLGAIAGVSPTYFVRRSTFEDLISTGIPQTDQRCRSAQCDCPLLLCLRNSAQKDC